MYLQFNRPRKDSSQKDYQLSTTALATPTSNGLLLSLLPSVKHAPPTDRSETDGELPRISNIFSFKAWNNILVSRATRSMHPFVLRREPVVQNGRTESMSKIQVYRGAEVTKVKLDLDLAIPREGTLVSLDVRSHIITAKVL